MNMRVSQYMDSSRSFTSISIVLSFITLSLSIVFKNSSAELKTELQPISIPTAAFGFILTMKFLELSIGHPWSYTRSMPLKLIMMYLLAFPKLPHRSSESREQIITNNNVRKESLFTAGQGIIEYMIYRVLLYWIPLSWLTVPSSDFFFFPRLARYGLLCILLYLLLTSFLNFTFGLVGWAMNFPMNRMFPAFPFTSNSLRDFWSYRWNHYIKSSLQRMSFVVIPHLLRPFYTVSKKTSGFFASLLSGLFHEYIYWFITDQWNYQNMFFFVVHGLLVRLEINWNIPVHPKSLQGRCLGCLWSISAILITAPLFFDPWIDIGVFSNLK